MEQERGRNMISYALKINDEKTVQLRLTSRSTVSLEDKLGKSPIEALMENQKVPTLNTSLTILHSCLQALEHGYSEEKTCDLYDEFVEAGGTLMDLIMALVETFKVSGFFKEAPKTEEPAKKTKK